MYRTLKTTFPKAFVVLMAFLLAYTPVHADDGPMVRKNVAKTPDLESDSAQMSMMQFYVPATSANGERTYVEYYADQDGDNQADALIETREYAKPLIITYIDEVPESTGTATGGDVEAAMVVPREVLEGTVNPAAMLSGGDFGPTLRRDAWAAFSLDDGTTWKQTNLSESALKTSFTLENGIEFPGDVPELVHAVAGNQILVAWTSKYCEQGSPRYSVKDEADADGDGDVEEPLYDDLFDVAGSQGSIDYAEWQHHGEYPFAEVGEIPFSCVWTARGTMEEVINPQSTLPQFGVRWRKAERVTSGKRDAYRITVDGSEGAGFTLTWQEDPEGLRPGSGEGPGVGWSGATVNHKTDIWYSYISATDFPVMQDADGNATLDPTQLDSNKPKVFTQMAMPVRVSDNYNCLFDRVDPDGLPHPAFCFEDFNGNGVDDFCATSTQWTNSQYETKNICVTEDGRLLNGQTGSSRPRMELQGYTKEDGTRSAWVILTYEETKGLGAGHTDIEPLDIGKDVMYHSFDMFNPDIVASGHMLNMPATDPLSDPTNPALLPFIENDMGELQYQTTIGRRPSLVVQPSSIIKERFDAGAAVGMTSAVLLYKDGEERQGGPSDIFMRSVVIPDGFDPAVHNPYAVANIACAAADTSISSTSPSAYPISAYPNGVCLDGEVNLSSVTPEGFEPLDNGDPAHGITERVIAWEQYPDNLDDEAWVNKYEVAKGHRGFIDGDFVMIMYAYSPNWLATSHGHEPYNLYIRRSFDGGETWTTTPAELGGDGTIYDQALGVGDGAWDVTRNLAAGEFEPARNVSQITTAKETVLDPRYSPTNMGTQQEVPARLLLADGTFGPLPIAQYEDDAIRDPSRFFGVYETGDATTVEYGEAEPLDLFYSRATNYGDDWDSVDMFANGIDEWEERWDWLENKADDFSGEASMGASPGGDFMWAVWNQWKEVDGHVYESDPIFRRLWWDDNEDPVADAGGDYESTVSAASIATDSLVTLLGSGTDPDGDPIVSYRWDLDSDGIFETDGRQVNFPSTGAPQTVALQVCDSRGACDVDTAWVNRAHANASRVWRIHADPNPALVGTLTAVTGRFNAPLGAAGVMWDWGDGSPQETGTMPEELQGKGAAFVTGMHTYGAAGLYPVTLIVTDHAGNQSFDMEYVAVYDPSAGYITGDGWFASPAGALIGNDQPGNLTFALDAKYGKNGGYLKGQITINLDTGGMSFAGTSLESLVIESSGMTHLRGAGTLNGTGGYEFLITLLDGGKKGTDYARVRIWHTGAGKNGHLVYDSQLGEPVGAAATQPLLEGNVTLHSDVIKVQADSIVGNNKVFLPHLHRTTQN